MAKGWLGKTYEFFFGGDDEEDLMEEPTEEPQRQPISRPAPGRWQGESLREPRPEPPRLRRNREMVLSLHGPPEKPTVEVHYPRSYEDAKRYGELFKEGKMVTVDLGSCDKRLRQQIIDFLSGVAFGLEGTAQKVNHTVFLFAPRSFVVIGDIPPISEDEVEP
jgi:cell division inhibitor SepF